MNVELVNIAIEKIRRMQSTALRYSDRGFIVAFSGGKDSQVLLELTKMAGVQYEAIHHLTTIDPPESVMFIRKHYPEVKIVRPALSFGQLVLHHGIMPTRTKRFCCKELKERFGAGRVVLTGVRRLESRNRADRQEVNILTRRRHPEFKDGTDDDFYRYQETQVQCLQGLDKLVFNPILYWSDDDVWSFIHTMNIPINPVYGMGCGRVGCVLCPLSSIASKRRDMKLWPKIADRWFRVFVRNRQQYRQRFGRDKYYGISDSEAFSCYLQEVAPDRSGSLVFADEEEGGVQP